MLAQLSGAVLGALAVKGLLLDEGRAGNYGALDVSPLLGSDFAGMIVEAIGTFCSSSASSPSRSTRAPRSEWGPLTIGLTFAFCVLIFGPLTGGCFNPARWFGPALVGNEWGGVWPYIVGPLVGALLAASDLQFVIDGRRARASSSRRRTGARPTRRRRTARRT